MYTDELKIKMKERAGEKWRPSNGTMGEIFYSENCQHCQHEDREKEIYCEILGDSMAFNVSDEKYPAELQIGPHGDPVCTAFSTKEENGQKKVVRCDLTTDMFD